VRVYAGNRDIVTRRYAALFDRHRNPLSDEFQQEKRALEGLERYLVQLWRESLAKPGFRGDRGLEARRYDVRYDARESYPDGYGPPTAGAERPVAGIGAVLCAPAVLALDDGAAELSAPTAVTGIPPLALGTCCVARSGPVLPVVAIVAPP
jgi:hypothetical protein